MIKGLWWSKTGQLVALERQQGGRNKRSPPSVCPRCSSSFTLAVLPFTKERLPPLSSSLVHSEIYPTLPRLSRSLLLVTKPASLSPLLHSVLITVI